VRQHRDYARRRRGRAAVHRRGDRGSRPDSRFGTERLYASLGEVAGDSPDQVIAALKADLHQFVASGPSDDVSLLAVRVD
jgi:serine phosphatase RsbU (regulator of sigma subunit)